METTENQQDKVPANDRENFGKQKKQRLNQAIFIRYEMPRPDGHIETVMDSYRNVLGRIYEHYDMETGKYEFTFKNQEGETLFKNEDPMRLREEIISNKTPMMQMAHEKRIAQKQKKEMTVAEKFRSNKQKKNISQQMTKEAETFVEKAVNESRDVMKTVHDFAGGEESSRAEEMQQLRQSKSKSKKREISR